MNLLSVSNILVLKKNSSYKYNLFVKFIFRKIYLFGFENSVCLFHYLRRAGSYGTVADRDKALCFIHLQILYRKSTKSILAVAALPKGFQNWEEKEKGLYRKSVFKMGPCLWIIHKLTVYFGLRYISSPPSQWVSHTRVFHHY